MPHSLLYVHHSDTPANLLKREALHIMVHNLPDINRREKYAALYKKLEARYERAYDKCTLPK